jgi:carboxyl-terminal processing protease
MKYAKRLLTCLIFSIVILFSSTSYGGLKDICDLIYRGEFEAAGDLIRENSEDNAVELDPLIVEKLLQIIDENTNICQRRQLTREAVYAGALADLEAFRAAVDVNGIDNIPAILTTIAKACEFADEIQKEQLLLDEFVNHVIQDAINNAAGLEDNGKWHDAYTDFYYWLVSIDPNNQDYANHAQHLIDKAAVVTAFKDSPCETCEERYYGIEKVMFTRAINFLSTSYISIIDYVEMATKAIEHCQLLSEALESDEFEEDPLLPTDGQAIDNWYLALTTLFDEITFNNRSNPFDKNSFSDVFEEVLKLNEITINLPQTALIAQFANAGLSELDPYTGMIWPAEVKNTLDRIINEITGIGVEIAIRDGLLTIVNLIPDAPAYQSGLNVGDIIAKVDGIEMRNMTIACAAQKITGPEGTDVTLTIRRMGENKTVDITITRARIVIPTIHGWQRTEFGQKLYMIDEVQKFGYVRISSFSSDTSSGLEEALIELEAEGLRAMILDLRFNTGGLLDKAVETVDKFVSSGCIVSIHHKTGVPPTYKIAHRNGTHPNYPLVILVNSSSASASEIVAGALADEVYERAILVGTRTHGKGCVQAITDYPGGESQLKYTLANYHLPSGQKVMNQYEMKEQGRNDWGIHPDIELELRSDETKKMLDVQKENCILAQVDPNNIDQEWKKYTIEETLASDPQLAVGLLIIRTKLIELEGTQTTE